MNPFEYIIPLISVLVGVAIADFATSLHRLLRARSRVHWDWLPLLAALLALLTVLNLWWAFYETQDSTFYQTLSGFLPFAAQLILLFLLNAASLPDSVPKEGVNLRTFYRKNSAYFWILYAAYVFIIILQNVVARFASGGGFTAVIKQSLANFILLAVFISLVTIKKRWFHAAVVIALLVLVFSKWTGMNLGG